MVLQIETTLSERDIVVTIQQHYYGYLRTYDNLNVDDILSTSNQKKKKKLKFSIIPWLFPIFLVYCLKLILCISIFEYLMHTLI